MIKRFFLCLFILSFGCSAQARDQVRVVGSSTIYPFMAVIAEKFGKHSEFKSPIVETVGTGAGIKLFCSGNGLNYPDMLMASRRMTDKEVQLCRSNGVINVAEVKFGHDGIVVGSSAKEVQYNISKYALFLALAEKVPYEGKLVNNFYRRWGDIDKELSENRIEIYGPSVTSGTRSTFNELVMLEVCKTIPEFRAAFIDEKMMVHQCMQIRKDGVFIEMAENENLMIKKLNINKHALGIFGYNFLDHNRLVVQPAVIDNLIPNFKNIANGTYPISRPLYIYINRAHFKQVPGMLEFTKKMISDEFLGPNGYLVKKGLVPIVEDEMKLNYTSVFEQNQHTIRSF